MSKIQARVKVPKEIFVYSVLIKNQQFHRQTQNEKINELLCKAICSLLCSVCYLLSPCLSFTSRISVSLSFSFKRSAGQNGQEHPKLLLYDIDFILVIIIWFENWKH